MRRSRTSCHPMFGTTRHRDGTVESAPNSICVNAVAPTIVERSMTALRNFSRGRGRCLAVLAQPVQRLLPTEAPQFEMADFKDWYRNFGSKSTSHEEWPANILAEELQPAEDVDVAPDDG